MTCWKTDPWQSHVHGERSAHLSTESFCPCEPAADLFLRQGASSDRGRTIDHLMYVVLWNVSFSLCALSGTSLEKCSLCVHLSPSHQSITTLGNDIFHSEQDPKQETLPLLFRFSVCSAEDRNPLSSPLWLAFCHCLFWGADCHIRIACQSKGNSDNAESIYLSISAQPILEKSEISESKCHPDPTSCNSLLPAPLNSAPLR